MEETINKTEEIKKRIEERRKQLKERQETIVEDPRFSLVREVRVLKQKLADTDYKAIKYAEGLISEEEYAPIKAQRQEWRRKIEELTLKIKELGKEE